jgi:hypothetical protein
MLIYFHTWAKYDPKNFILKILQGYDQWDPDPLDPKPVEFCNVVGVSIAPVSKKLAVQ